jgi:hypothetical protein
VLGLGQGAALATTDKPTTNPLRYVPRFFSQPRLVLAWTLAAIRPSWWSMFFIYAPILAVTSGLGAETGGIVASIGTAFRACQRISRGLRGVCGCLRLG